MQEKSLAVNVFDEGNSSSQTNHPEQDEANGQLKTSDGKPFTKQVTDTSAGPGATPRNDGDMMMYAPWIAAGIVVVVVLVSLLAIIRKLNKKARNV